ncbi:MAG TPA: alanine racemase [Parachlamydiaceae bacterium]|nr:alanine racemase [Parachlamydiaceae bacterium]
MDPFDLRDWEGFQKSGGSLKTPAIIDQVVIDSRRIHSKNALFAALSGAFQDGHQFVKNALEQGAKFCLVKKDYKHPETLPEHVTVLTCDNPLHSLQEIARCYRLSKKAKVIAITGSFGKTMVKDLLVSFLKEEKQVAASPESFNSQIGVALSLFTIARHHEIAVIEAAVSEKNEMDRLFFMVEPDAMLLTHIGKKHQTTLGNLAASASEMMKMGQSLKSWALIPDCPKLSSYAQKIVSCFFWNQEDKILPFATYKNHLKNAYELQFPGGFSFSGTIHAGFHYFLDLLNMAVKAAFLENISVTSICKALKEFTLQPMRTELWQSKMGSLFINGTYCEDPQSIDLSLKYFDQSLPNSKKTFIFSGIKGEKKEHDYKRIGQSIATSDLEELMLIGKHPFSPLIEEVKAHSPKTSITLHPTIEEAIKKLQLKISPNDLVLIKGEKKEPLDKIEEAFDGSISSSQCTINLAAVQANLTAIRATLKANTRIMVMVKALGYGTSDVRMAKFLHDFGVDALGVSYVDEGVSLKKASVLQDIFVLNAAPYEIPKVIEWDLQVGVSDKNFIENLQLSASSSNKKIKVHLHVNTGMNRFGCLLEEALPLALLIHQSSHLVLEGIMTHFAAADDKKEDAFTKMQADLFLKVIREIELKGIEIPLKHACNSSALLRFSFPEFNMVRIGLAVYGLYPSKETENSLGLRLAISLTSKIVGINLCKKGDTISYGRSYKVDADHKRIAVLPIGYFDGLHRNYSGKADVMVLGKKAAMVGKICMDYMMIDISDVPDAKVGDKVLIFGEDEYGHYISPEDFATNGDSIIYELITCLGPRIQRIFIFEEASTLR